MSVSSVEVVRQQTRYAVEQLLRFENFVGEVHDACYRDSAIIETFAKNGNSCFRSNCDFLKCQRGTTNIVTEPTPKEAEVVLRKALTLVTDKVALLLPLPWMATLATKKLFDETPIARIYMFTHRLRYRPRLMAWYVFVKGHFTLPVLRWL